MTQVVTAQAAAARYDAFISYRRSDGAQAARWVRRELESFRLPPRLRSGNPARLKIYLDTAYERGATDFFEQSIRPALLASRHLLVLATPDAVRRRADATDWIAREIDEFMAGPYAGNVLVGRVAGAFDGDLPGDLSKRFGNVEIVDLRDISRFWFLNPARASRISDEKLKLVAPLFGIAHEDMPVLRREEERRQQQRIGLVAGVTLATMTTVVGLSVAALHSSWRAAEALEASMFATRSMVSGVAGALPASAVAKSDPRATLLSTGCDLIDMLRRTPGGKSDSKPEEQIICLGERAFQHVRMGERARGEALLAEIAALLPPTPKDGEPSPLRSLAQRVLGARTAVPGDLPKEDEARIGALTAIAAFADTALTKVMDERRLRINAANAHGRLYDALLASGAKRAALAPLIAAQGHLDRAIVETAAEESASLRVWRDRLLRLRAGLLWDLDQKDEGLAIAREAVKQSESSVAAVPGNAAISVEMAYSHATLARMSGQQGEARGQREASAEAARTALARVRQPVEGSLRGDIDAIGRILSALSGR